MHESGHCGRWPSCAPPTITALAEPGTRTSDGLANEALLGLIVEDVSGQPLARVIHERVAAPAGLDDTSLAGAGWVTPARWRHGMLAFNGAMLDTSAFDPTSYLTWNQAAISSVSTPTDLLDLLDAWTTADLFTTDRTPRPDRYAPEPVESSLLPDFHAGLGVPFNGSAHARRSTVASSPPRSAVRRVESVRELGSSGTPTASPSWSM